MARLLQTERFSHQLLIMGSATGFSALAALAQTFLLAKHLGLESFGMLALVQSFGIMVWTLCNLSTFQPLITHTERLKHGKNAAEIQKLLAYCLRLDIRMAMIAFALFMLLNYGFAFTGIWSESLLKADITNLCLLFSPVVILLVLQNTALGYFRYEQQFPFLASHKIFFALFSTLLVALSVAEDMAVHICLMAIVAGRVGEYGSLFFCMVWKNRFVLKHSASHTLNLPTLKKSIFGSYGQNFVFNLVENGDVFIAAILLGEKQAGLLRIIRTVVNALQLGIIPLRQVCLPMLSKLVVTNAKNKLLHFQVRYFKFVLIIGISFLAVLGILYQPVTRLLPELTSISLATLSCFSLAILMSYLSVPLMPVLMANHWDMFLLKLISTLLLVYLLLIFLGYQTFGLLAFAIAYLAFYTLLVVSEWLVLHRKGWIGEHA